MQLWLEHFGVAVSATAALVKVTFGYPRVNGQPPKLKSARVVHPGPGEQSASPDCATAMAEGSDVVVTVGKIFEREAKDRKHPLALKEPAPRN